MGAGSPEKATPKSKKNGPFPHGILVKFPDNKVPLPITKFTNPNWSVVTFCRSEYTMVPVAVVCRILTRIAVGVLAIKEPVLFRMTAW